jgi:hypothetical protein
MESSRHPRGSAFPAVDDDDAGFTVVFERRAVRVLGPKPDVHGDFVFNESKQSVDGEALVPGHVVGEVARLGGGNGPNNYRRGSCRMADARVAPVARARWHGA